MTAQPARYSLTRERQLDWSSQLLLRKIVEESVRYSILLEGEAICLREPLDSMHIKNVLEISDKKGTYEPTALGITLVKKFNQRWVEYLSVFDLFCAVDLKSGEFAMSRYFDPMFADNTPAPSLTGEPSTTTMGEVLWTAFLNEERWEDMRVAVAEFKGTDPLNIVFMSFLKAGRIDTETPGWEFKMMTGEIWQEIIDVSNTNVGAEDQRLEYTTEDGRVIAPAMVMQDLIKAGSAVMFELLKQQQELEKEARVQEEAERAARQAEEPEAIPETITTVEPYTFWVDDYVAYYDPYWDPFYISPIWGPFWY